MGVGRNTTTRDRHRKTIARDEPPCGICGQPINYQLPHLDPGSYVVDHIIPINRGGDDALANKQAAHRQPSLQPNQIRPHPRRTPTPLHHRTNLVTHLYAPPGRTCAPLTA